MMYSDILWVGDSRWFCCHWSSCPRRRRRRGQWPVQDDARHQCTNGGAHQVHQPTCRTRLRYRCVRGARRLKTTDSDHCRLNTSTDNWSSTWQPQTHTYQQIFSYLIKLRFPYFLVPLTPAQIREWRPVMCSSHSGCRQVKAQCVSSVGIRNGIWPIKHRRKTLVKISRGNQVVNPVYLEKNSHWLI